jgi:cytochrome c peroxidase
MKAVWISPALGLTALLWLFLADPLNTLGQTAPEGRQTPAGGASAFDDSAMQRLLFPPLGLPPVPIPEDNDATKEKIALGRKLFFDRRLSFNNTLSCGMCHIPEQGFTNNELATPIGAEGRSLRRNAPTILNTAFATHIFHDGRDTSLETQIISPLLAADEMANPSIGWLIAKIDRLEDYDGLFERAFGEGPSVENLGKAIAGWERSLLAGDSPFDRWRYAGQADALSAEQARGFELFTGRAACASCHVIGEDHALLTDGQFHDTGIGYNAGRASRDVDSPVQVEIAPGVFLPVDRDLVRSVEQPRKADLGRFEVTLDPDDRWRFRTPSLRNVAVTGPYMHDGSLQSLEKVVAFYVRGGVPHPELDPLIGPLDLTDSEQASLVAFLRSLTSANLPALQADARSIAVGN